jgi:pyruvate kinase
LSVYDERRVKIVATLGPASRERDTLRELFLAGLDVVRINAAHGTPEERAVLVNDVRTVADEVGKLVPILFDLRGLKIRTGPLANPAEESVGIPRGGAVTIVNTPAPTTNELIGIDFPQLFEFIHPGSRILISDGLIELLVERIDGKSAQCHVGRGGQLHGRQGVTLPEAMIKGGSLTPVDREDLQWGVEQGVDFIGLSFVSDASDLHLAREVAGWYSPRPPQLIAKIERPQALENVRSIAGAADGLMVARGDLGVQMAPERVPRAQKEIIRVANEFALPAASGHPRRNHGRGQRSVGRHRRRDALGGNSDWAVPDRGRAHHGTHYSRGGDRRADPHGRDREAAAEPE